MMKRKGRGQGITNGKAALIGCTISVVTTLFLLCAETYFVMTETISENLCERITPAIQFLGAAIGCIVAARSTGAGFTVSSFIAAVGYFLLLAVISAIIFEGSFSSVLNGLLAIVLGAITAAAFLWRRNRGTNPRRRGSSR